MSRDASATGANVTQVFKFLQKFFWASLLFCTRGVFLWGSFVSLWYRKHRGWGGKVGKSSSGELHSVYVTTGPLCLKSGWWGLSGVDI
jgi:hypothetical protein